MNMQGGRIIFYSQKNTHGIKHKKTTKTSQTETKNETREGVSLRVFDPSILAYFRARIFEERA